MSSDPFALAEQSAPWPLISQRVCDLFQAVNVDLARLVTALPRRAWGVDSGFFYLPIAQAIEWGEKSSERHLRLGVTFAVGHLYYALHDRLVDSGTLTGHERVLADLSHHLYLSQVSACGVPGKAIFKWQTELASAYAKALVSELNLRDSPRMLTSEETWSLGDKAAPAGLSFIAASPCTLEDDQIATLLRSLRWLASGLQLLDDLEDIEGDFESGLWSLPISLGYSSSAVELPWKTSDPRITAENLKDACYLGGGASAVTKLADYAFERAASLARDGGALVLARLADKWQLAARERLNFMSADD